MTETAFIVKVPEAELHVASLRQRFDASFRLGVPAHITVLVPFMTPEQITPGVLTQAQDALNEVAAFAFSLVRVGRFPATAYLAPEPAAPFIALTEALVRRFPGFPPFRGEHPFIVPHLTVAHGDASDAAFAAAELEKLIRFKGSISGHCASVSLLENASGQWREMHVLPLASR